MATYAVLASLLFLHFSKVGSVRMRPDVFSVVASGFGVVVVVGTDGGPCLLSASFIRRMSIVFTPTKVRQKSPAIGWQSYDGPISARDRYRQWICKSNCSHQYLFIMP